MKRLIAVFIVALIACVALAGCPSEQQPAAETDNGVSSETPDNPSETEPPEQEKVTKMYITVNGNKLEVALADNSSVDALVEILKRGDVTYTANDYGGFEKVGDIGHTLPQNNTQITTQAGDVILYQGRNICLYYDTNSWSFTRIGRINGYSPQELRTLLGAGNGSVRVTVSLS